MDSQKFATLFPLGTHLCREPMPSMSELKRDMENLKRHGFNLIKLQEHWMIDEPREGEYDFSRHEELIAHAAKLDLGVYLGLTCEQAPPWLWRKHPDCAMVTRNGIRTPYIAPTTLPCDGKPGPCFDHPGAMAEQLRFIRKLVAVLGRFENLVIWNTWQEIAYWSNHVVGDDVCFCPNTLTSFQGWLREKFGNLDALNYAWNTRYSAWEDILPSRGPAKGCYAIDIAFQYFMDNVQIANVLRARAQAIKEADPLKRPVFAHKSGPAIGTGQDWTYARCQDFLGSSCYPAWGSFETWDDGNQISSGEADFLMTEAWNNICLRYDYIRACSVSDNPVWAAEFQGGPVNTGFHKGRVPSPADIRRWMLTAVGSGVTAISFWATRAEIMAAETNGFSLLDSTGDTTSRFEEAARLGQSLNRHVDLFAKPSLSKAEVAILIDEWNYQLCAAMAQAGQHLPYSIRGWHRMLWEANIPVDFVEISHISDEELSAYKVLIMPFPLSLSEAIAARLKLYVESGGHLISEAAPGRLDENAFANRGELSPILAELFGVTQKSFTMVKEPDDGIRWSPTPRTWGEYLQPAMLVGVGLLTGHTLRANVYLETFALNGAEPCFLYGGAIAGVVRAVGKGIAWLLGTYVGHNGTAYRDEETRKCVLSLLAQNGVKSPYEGQLLLRKWIGNNKEAWLFTNPTANAITESITIQGWERVVDLS